MDTKIKKTDTKIKKTDNVTIYGTGKSSFMPKDKKYVEHRTLAETLVTKGFATVKKTESK